MQIVCPQCAATYEVADGSIGAEGRKVRCAACRTVWVAMPELVAAGAESFAPPPPETLVPDPPPEPPIAEEVPDRLIDSAPPLTPADAPEPTHEPVDAPLVRRSKRLHKAAAKTSLKGWTTVILALLAVITGIIAFRSDVVRLMPQTASLFEKIGMSINARGLAFHDVSTTLETQEGVPVLVITGVIVNMTKQPLGVPRLRLALLNEAGREVHSWSALPERSFLGPREAQPVKIRLASPPAESSRVQMRFFTRVDAGGR